MKLVLSRFFIVSVVSLGCSFCLGGQGLGGQSPAGQTLTADRFLDRVAAHYVGDEVERDQSAEAYEALNAASPAEVQRMLPILLVYKRGGSEAHVRAYAALFLSAIAIRSDGAELLSSRPKEISSLIVDLNPGIQKVAVAITDYLIGRPHTDNQPYIEALAAAMQMTRTPQDAASGMIVPLMTFGSSDPVSVKAVLDFMGRNDLTLETRRELPHTLGSVEALPDPVNLALSKLLDDPDASVRVSALVAFADSTTRFHNLAKDRVEKMANDPQENPKVRDLAKEAVAGKTHLNPNILIPNSEIEPTKPSLP